MHPPALKRLFALILYLLPAVNLTAQTCPLSSDAIAFYNREQSQANISDYAASVVAAEEATGFIILLGGSATGVFTIEGGDRNDASNIRYANLVFTSYSGKRKSYKLPDMDLEQSDNTDSIRTVIKQQTMRQMQLYQKRKVYTITSLQPIHFEENPDKEDVSWTLRIEGNKRKLQWSLNAAPSMCWCFFKWECVSLKITKS